MEHVEAAVPTSGAPAAVERPPQRLRNSPLLLRRPATARPGRLDWRPCKLDPRQGLYASSSRRDATHGARRAFPLALMAAATLIAVAACGSSGTTSTTRP